MPHRLPDRRAPVVVDSHSVPATTLWLMPGVVSPLELYGCGHHRRDTGQREVERRNLVPEIAHERQDEAAERRVDVEGKPAAGRQVGERFDGIHQPEAPGRRGCDQPDCAPRDGPLDVFDPGSEVVGDVDLDEADAKDLRTEAEGEVHRHPRDHLWRGATAAVAHEPERREVRFRAAGGDNADGVWRAEQRGHHPDRLTLEADGAGFRFVGPLDEKGPLGQRLDPLADRVWRARVGDREIVLGRVLVLAESRLDLGEHGFLGLTGVREAGGRRDWQSQVLARQVELGGRHRLGR